MIPIIYISQLLETPKLKEIVETYNIGLEVISFSIGFILDELEQSINYYKKDFQTLEVPLTFHGPFLDLLPGSCDKKVKQLTRERFEAAYKAALDFGVSEMIFHTGYMPNTYPDQYWLENVISFWKEFLEGKIDKCTFYIENVLDLDWKLLKEIIDQIDHPNFKVCLDIGHINVYSKVPVEEWIKGLGDRIGYVHLHNNDGTKDAHDGLLNGSLPMKHILSMLKVYAPKASWSLEISDEYKLIQSLDWLQELNYLQKH